MEVIGSRASWHAGNPDHPAWFERNEALAHQIEIGDAIDFVVVGDARGAIAKAELGPHIDFDFAAARLRSALERASRGPAVTRKWPGDFAPALDIRTSIIMTGGADHRTSRNGKRGQQSTHLA